MSWPGLAGLVVGAVLVVSGAAKLASPQWPAQAAQLGAPGIVVRVLSPLELVLGALVATGALPPWAPVAALVLLAAFTVVVVRALVRGRRPPCACFGALSRRPIGPGTVVRNVGLMVLAAVAAAG